ncbi:hypothetical protein ABK040_003613 [Willaertia magna]
MDKIPPLTEILNNNIDISHYEFKNLEGEGTEGFVGQAKILIIHYKNGNLENTKYFIFKTCPLLPITENVLQNENLQNLQNNILQNENLQNENLNDEFNKLNKIFEFLIKTFKIHERECFFYKFVMKELFTKFNLKYNYIPLLFCNEKYLIIEKINNTYSIPFYKTMNNTQIKKTLQQLSLINSLSFENEILQKYEENFEKIEETNEKVYKIYCNFYSLNISKFIKLFIEKSNNFEEKLEMKEILENKLTNILYDICFTKVYKNKIWKTLLTHGDLWGNNILIKNNEIYLIDFQFFVIGNVLQDIAFLLFTMCDLNSLKNNQKEFIIHYFNNLKQNLQELSFTTNQQQENNLIDKIGSVEDCWNDYEQFGMILGFVQLVCSVDVFISKGEEYLEMIQPKMEFIVKEICEKIKNF